MKKTFKRLFITIASVILVLTISCFFKAKAELVTTNQLVVNGASVRTDDKAGIKFEAQSTYVPAEGTSVQAYGIVVMLGAHETETVYVGAENAYTALVGKTDEEGKFYLTIFNFPQAAYVNEITARAYVKLDDDSLVYAETATIRSLAEVSIGAKELQVEGEFIDTVVNYVAGNYKNVWTDSQNNVHISSSIYETVPENLGKKFIADWNKKFGTEFTEYSYTAWATSAKAGYGAGTGLTDNGDTDCSGTNAYEFFITDPETSAKWKWLLTYFLEETNTFVHPKRQINALLNNGSATDSYGSGLQQFAHLSRSLQNFFDATGGDVYGSGIDVIIKDFAIYDAIATYNTTVYSSNPELVLIGDSINLEVLEKTGYTYEGNTDGSSSNLNSYVVTESSAMLKPEFKPIEYNITYYDGETELTDLSSTYTIESEKIMLAEYTKAGHIFKGWYTTSTFDEGTEATSIAAGSTGNKYYYAKLESTDNIPVNVTLNPNGGMWDAATVLENVENLEEAKLTKYDEYQSGGLEASLHSTKPSAVWWYYIVLNKTSIDGVYEISTIVDKNANLPTTFDYVITWHDNLTDAATKTTLTKIYSNSSEYVGKYVILENVPQAASSSCSINVSIVDPSEITNSFSKEYQNAETLPTPTKEGSTFYGWKSSVDGSIVTEYPGYKTNPGDITYTAQWDVSYDYADVNVTFELDGGEYDIAPTAPYAKLYPTVDDAIADFLKDYNTLRGTSHTVETFYALGSMVEISGASQFLYNATYKAKWTWLVNYIAGVAGSNNKKAFANFYNYSSQSELNTADTNYIYCIAYELRGWVGQTQYTKNSGFVTANYSSSTVKAAYDTAVTLSNAYYYNKPCALPTPVKTGYKFMGWKSSLDGSVVTNYPGYETNPGNITYTAQWDSILYSNVNVTLNADGGSFLPANMNASSTFTVSAYSNICPADKVYMSDTSVTSYSSLLYVYKIVLNYDETLNAYKVVAVDAAKTKVKELGVTWTHVIAHNTTNITSYAKVGDYIYIDKASLSAGTAQTAKVYNDLSNYTTQLKDPCTLPTPVKEGYKFAGWKSSVDGSIVTKYPGYDASVTSVTYTAQWAFDDTLIGAFKEGVSYVVVSENNPLGLSATYLSGANRELKWMSENTSIATVDESGYVTGLKAGLATITAYDAEYPSIEFVFYVTVFDTTPTGLLKVLVDSNNADIYTVEDLIIGITGATPAPYYADLIVGSVSKLLFEDYVVHKDYYLANPTNKSTLTGVDFITFHYAADMPYSANYSLKGGMNLASANKSQNANGTQASWHYSVGNDGVWYCQNTAYGAWHAGSSQTMSWHASGVTTSQVGTDVYTTDVTLKSDNYFYIKGVKTNIKNTTGYSYTKFNKMGLGVKLVGSEWYLSGHYYKSSYGYIGSVGGNQNSIGIESSVREGSDLWLTWQYGAQLCAKLLTQFNLPLNRLVGHHFFTGKWCPQPMLENNLEIWYEFVDMVRQQKAYFDNYSNNSLSFSTNSVYLKNNGRISSLPEYTECVTYTVNYGAGSVTLSSILPGTLA